MAWLKDDVLLSISINKHLYFKLYIFEDQNLQLLNRGLKVFVELPLKDPNSGQKLLKTNGTFWFLTQKLLQVRRHSVALLIQKSLMEVVMDIKEKFIREWIL